MKQWRHYRRPAGTHTHTQRQKKVRQNKKRNNGNNHRVRSGKQEQKINRAINRGDHYTPSLLTHPRGKGAKREREGVKRVLFQGEVTRGHHLLSRGWLLIDCLITQLPALEAGIPSAAAAVESAQTNQNPRTQKPRVKKNIFGAQFETNSKTRFLAP